MKLEDFHRMVSSEVKRGDRLDAMIPLYTKQAVNFLERNWPLKYMEEWVYITLAPGDQVVDMIWSFRNFRFLRRPSATEWLYMRKANPQEETMMAGMDTGHAYAQDTTLNKYFQIGVRYVRFNAVWNGAENLPIEGIVYKYSDWQQTKPDFRHFLLDQGSDLLLYQTMLRIGAAIRDPRVKDLYLGLRDEALRTFLTADEDSEYAGMDDGMEYGGIYK